MAAVGNRNLGEMIPYCIENPMIIFAIAEAAPMGPNKRFACRVVNRVFVRSQNCGIRIAPIISIHT